MKWMSLSDFVYISSKNDNHFSVIIFSFIKISSSINLDSRANGFDAATCIASCFPKDLNALINLAEKQGLGLDINVLKATLDTNNKVRTNRDWENQKGRAVI